MRACPPPRLRPPLLLLAAALLAATLPACRSLPFGRRAGDQEAAPPSFPKGLAPSRWTILGHIVRLDPTSRLVAVELRPGLPLPLEAAVRSARGTEIVGRLAFTAARVDAIVAATIVEGDPALGDEVVLPRSALE